MATRTVDVGLFSFSLDAYHAQAFLEENGIVASVTGVQAGTLWGSPGVEAVRVAVREEDAERATALLKELRSGEDAVDADPESDGPDPNAGEFDPDSEVDSSESESDDGAPPPAPRDYGRTVVPASTAPANTGAADDAWARRTRAGAVISIAVWLLMIPTIWRLTSPRAKGDLSPLARTYLRQARLALWTAITVMVVFLAGWGIQSALFP